ncbi:hypothetical protein [Dyella subtropica]|uniref:hypothetical protein n=1 Tax=Dyella subtropica TaxID=2992127 RepID=UPI00225B3AD3|nr:hypothetical protein [Dyella subtropica]
MAAFQKQPADPSKLSDVQVLSQGKGRQGMLYALSIADRHGTSRTLHRTPRKFLRFCRLEK